MSKFWSDTAFAQKYWIAISLKKTNIEQSIEFEIINLFIIPKPRNLQIIAEIHRKNINIPPKTKMALDFWRT